MRAHVASVVFIALVAAVAFAQSLGPGGGGGGTDRVETRTTYVIVGSDGGYVETCANSDCLARSLGVDGGIDIGTIPASLLPSGTDKAKLSVKIPPNSSVRIFSDSGALSYSTLAFMRDSTLAGYIGISESTGTDTSAYPNGMLIGAYDPATGFHNLMSASRDGTAVQFGIPANTPSLLFGIGKVAAHKLDVAGNAAASGFIPARATLQTCSAALEGLVAVDGASGAATGARTRLCLCTSSGSSAYAWQNTVTGTVATNTTCTL